MGGENEFADAFQVAEIIREKHPEDFKVLTEQEVEFWDVGVEDDVENTGRQQMFHKVTNLPTIQ